MTASSHFRIGTSLKIGPNGEVLRVSVYERICADHECLANTFLIDLQCLPDLKAEIDRVFDKATRDGRFQVEGDRE